MTNKLFLLSLFLASLSANDPHSPTLVRLTPPTITSNTISEEITCTRPMRNGKFNISVSEADGKTIVNCYGHGGSGWTTLWGSVQEAVELFESTNPDKLKPICVIGSGCMGLTSAIELTRHGYQVSRITSRDLYNIPSWRAAGYFALVSVKTSPEEQAHLDVLGANSFKGYQLIERGEHPYISADAVRYMPTFCSSATDSGLENMEAIGMIPPREYVTLDFGNGVVHTDFVKYMTYFLNTTTILKQLHQEVKRLGIPIELGEVKSLSEVSENYIFNCAGLGARELGNDSDMIPVRGHLVALNSASGTHHMDYMIYTLVSQDDKDEYIYMFPKDSSVTPENKDGKPCFSVLGGTFIPNANSLTPEELKKLDELEFKRLLDRNSIFFYGRPFQE